MININIKRKNKDILHDKLWSPVFLNAFTDLEQCKHHIHSKNKRSDKKGKYMTICETAYNNRYANRSYLNDAGYP